MKRDADVANIYLWKKQAKETRTQNYTENLLKIRNECEQRALASLQMSEAYQAEIEEMEQREKELIENLSKTLTKNNYLMKDLAFK